MSTQTFFRRLKTPAQAIYANKIEGTSVYTMYSQPEPVYLRQTCQGTPANVQMQDFVLQVGTPATAFQTCWDEWCVTFSIRRDGRRLRRRAGQPLRCASRRS